LILQGRKQDNYAGNYSQEKTTASVWSRAIHGRLQKSKAGTSLGSCCKKKTEVDHLERHHLERLHTDGQGMG